MPPPHEVNNQVPPHTGRDITTHPALFEALHREGAGWAEEEVRALGALGNSATVQEWGRLANERPPVLHTHDRYGCRVDEVEYLPQYHDLMRTAVEHGLHGAPWADDRPGALRKQSADDVGRCPGRERDHKVDRPRRPGVGECTGCAAALANSDSTVLRPRFMAGRQHVARISAATCGIGPRGRPRMSLRSSGPRNTTAQYSGSPSTVQRRNSRRCSGGQSVRACRHERLSHITRSPGRQTCS